MPSPEYTYAATLLGRLAVGVSNDLSSLPLWQDGKRVIDPSCHFSVRLRPGTVFQAYRRVGGKRVMSSPVDATAEDANQVRLLLDHYDPEDPDGRVTFFADSFISPTKLARRIKQAGQSAGIARWLRCSTAGLERHPYVALMYSIRGEVSPLQVDLAHLQKLRVGGLHVRVAVRVVQSDTPRTFVTVWAVFTEKGEGVPMPRRLSDVRQRAEALCARSILPTTEEAQSIAVAMAGLFPQNDGRISCSLDEPVPLPYPDEWVELEGKALPSNSPNSRIVGPTTPVSRFSAAAIGIFAAQTASRGGTIPNARAILGLYPDEATVFAHDGADWYRTPWRPATVPDYVITRDAPLAVCQVACAHVRTVGVDFDVFQPDGTRRVLEDDEVWRIVDQTARRHLEYWAGIRTHICTSGRGVRVLLFFREPVSRDHAESAAWATELLFCADGIVKIAGQFMWRRPHFGGSYLGVRRDVTCLTRPLRIPGARHPTQPGGRVRPVPPPKNSCKMDESKFRGGPPMDPLFVPLNRMVPAATVEFPTVLDPWEAHIAVNEVECARARAIEAYGLQPADGKEVAASPSNRHNPRHQAAASDNDLFLDLPRRVREAMSASHGDIAKTREEVLADIHDAVACGSQGQYDAGRLAGALGRLLATYRMSATQSGQSDDVGSEMVVNIVRMVRARHPRLRQVDALGAVVAHAVAKLDRQPFVLNQQNIATIHGVPQPRVSEAIQLLVRAKILLVVEQARKMRSAGKYRIIVPTEESQYLTPTPVKVYRGPLSPLLVRWCQIPGLSPDENTVVRALYADGPATAAELALRHPALLAAGTRKVGYMLRHLQFMGCVQREEAKAKHVRTWRVVLKNRTR